MHQLESSSALRLITLNNRPMHGFCRHLGCGAVAAKITVIVWDIYCSTVNADNSAIIHRILILKKTDVFLKGIEMEII